MAGKNTKRPIHLDLLRIRLPVGGIVSIMHRITGVLLVVALPVILWCLQLSLSSETDYQRIASLLQNLPLRIGYFLLILALTHHFLAGVRHLLLDLDIGMSRVGGRMGAWLVLGLGAFAAIVLLRLLFL